MGANEVIRTPMNAIIGYTTLINKEADEPTKVWEYLCIQFISESDVI